MFSEHAVSLGISSTLSITSRLLHGHRVLGLAICVVASGYAAAANVSLEWDPVHDERVAYYEVHYGTVSGEYAWSQVSSSTSATVADLAEGSTYYFAARACADGGSLCSAFSEEVSTTLTAAKPEVSFSMSASTGVAPLGVSFTDNSTGAIDSYLWDFGDGNTSTESSPRHVFASDGLYSITLTVTGPGGTSTLTQAGAITVQAESVSFTMGGQTNPIVTGDDPALIGDDLPMEFGEIELDHQWQRVDFARPFYDPVVIVKPSSGNDGAPAVVRVDAVDGDGFFVRIQEWDYLDDVHTTETVGYLVVERGIHPLPDGGWIEADVVEISGQDGYLFTAFSAPFTEVPVVFSAVATASDPGAVTTRMRAIDYYGFELVLQREEASSKAHDTETVAYVAWEPSVGEVNGITFEVGNTFDEVTHDAHLIGFNSNFRSAPVLLADMQTTDGPDTATVRLRNKGPFSAEIWVEEEQSRDRETRHTTEVVGYLAIGAAGPLPSMTIEAGELDVDDQWQRVDFTEQFSEPVVIAKIVSAYDTEPAVIRMDGLDGTGFWLRLQEWEYLDDLHAAERVHYLVMERGRHQLEDGSWLEAGLIDTGATSSFRRAGFGVPFVDPPVVLTTIHSYSGADAVVTRVRNVDVTGFDVKLQEQESSAQEHVPETIGYIALEPGVVQAEHLRLKVGRTADTVTHNPYAVEFSNAASSLPLALLADMQSTDGGDTASLRYDGMAENSVDVWVEEEQSKDSETAHTTETVGYILAY